jgi:4-hydroxybenzoate polyprenyltransferase
MSGIKDYFSLVKIQHTLFALPFAMIGFFLAFRDNGESISLRILLLVILCVLFARNAAMGFNRYIDREFDMKNPRTALREIPRQIISPRSALWFVILNAGLFILTTWFLNPLCFFLSPVALIVVLGYSFTKRFTSLAHLFLGMGLALAPIGAYLAVTAHFAVVPVLYSFAVLFWVAGFDIIYALQDYDFDMQHALKSVPVMMGKRSALILSSIFHVLALALIYAASYFGRAGKIHWTGAAIFTGLVVYQHLLVKPNDISKVNLAFFTLNGVASVIFAGFVIADLFFFG